MSIWVNDDRTVLARTAGPGKLEVATRADSDGVWGPPMSLVEDDTKLAIIGRERYLIDQLTEALQKMVGGPPPTKRTLAFLRIPNSTRPMDTNRGSRFEVQIVDSDDGVPTGHIARVTVELDRFERSSSS